MTTLANELIETRTWRPLRSQLSQHRTPIAVANLPAKPSPCQTACMEMMKSTWNRNANGGHQIQAKNTQTQLPVFRTVRFQPHQIEYVSSDCREDRLSFGQQIRNPRHRIVGHHDGAPPGS